MNTGFPAGKLPHEALALLLERYTGSDPRLVVAPSVGEDAAVIEFGDRYLVAKTDPITFATDAIGWYAVNVNANDIAAMGATPLFFLATVLMPAGQADAVMAESIFRSVHEAAAALGITVCGGHTEITPAVRQPVVVGVMLGEVSRAELVRSSGLAPGDALVLTKGLAIEATAIIAREKAPQVRARGYSDEMIERCANYLHDPGISVVRDARVACAAGGVRAMHDPTEGGVASGLLELALASGVGLEVHSAAIPVARDTVRLCTEFRLDPLGAISSGALLIGCRADSAAGIVAALQQEGITASRIGTVHEESHGLQLCSGEQRGPLPRFAVDEITRLFQD